MALQIRRRIGGTAAAPAELEEGQLAYNLPDSEVDALYIGDDENGVRTLVSAQRQVELAGTQTITGSKTISISNLHITGGSNGYSIATDGSGGLTWVAAPPASVITATPITGNGLTATPIGLALASAGDVTTGTDNILPITSLRLREQLGLDRADLDRSDLNGWQHWRLSGLPPEIRALVQDVDLSCAPSGFICRLDNLCRLNDVETVADLRELVLAHGDRLPNVGERMLRTLCGLLKIDRRFRSDMEFLARDLASLVRAVGRVRARAHEEGSVRDVGHLDVARLRLEVALQALEGAGASLAEVVKAGEERHV